jgi:hypothetical protein
MVKARSQDARRQPHSNAMGLSMGVTDDEDSGAPARRSPWRFESLLALVLVAFGLLVLPALIYFTGTILLGAYGGGEHLGSYYGDFARDLGLGSALAWILVVGPYLLVQLARLIFSGFGTSTSATESPRQVAEPAVPRSPDRPRERREPTLKL